MNKATNYLMKSFDNFMNNYHIHKVRRNMQSKVARLRQKDVIKVLFVLPNLPKWKTEPLYQAMLRHPRFEPHLALALTGNYYYPSAAISSYNQLKDYVERKKYKYTELRDANDYKRLNPDVIFHQEAAGGGINNNLMFYSYPDCLYCYVLYAFDTNNLAAFINTPYQNACWKYFVANSLEYENGKALMNNKAANMCVTGVPMQDELRLPNDLFSNPWKEQPKAKKKIIWAPHFTFSEKGYAAVSYSTFLSFSETMISFAKTYAEEVQFAFKPHPSLRSALYSLWGREKTDDYYNQWATMPNTQVETGKYTELFKFSDAIIHDCGSITVENLYTHKPCMYLDNGNDHDLNKFGQMSLDQYYIGKTTEDINLFIKNVISGIDPRREEREQFYKQYLLPPGGNSACYNIINSLLGEEA